MIKFINANGGEMWVHESRVSEYEAMGHKIAPRPIPEKKKPPVKKSPKKQG